MPSPKSSCTVSPNWEAEQVLIVKRHTHWIGALASAVVLLTGALATSKVASAQTAYRDGIADLLAGETPADGKPAAKPEADPRAGDPDYERARELMRAIDALLQDTAQNRSDAARLPGRDEFLVTPIWTETKEDREAKIRDLLDSVLGIVTDVPVVDVQKRVEALRQNIRKLEDEIVNLRERKLSAPEGGMLPGVLTDTVESLQASIEDAEKRIEANRTEIGVAKTEIKTALKTAGIQLGDDQIDLLLDSVLSGDLVRLVAVFNAAKLIDRQLGERMEVSGDNIKAARKYFAMHAALFAMLVHAQDSAIEKIDNAYMPKLDAILRDIRAARAKTDKLLKKTNRPDQRRVLEANRESQKLAREAAQGYRRYLQQQREQIARARARATHDLSIADNTFETVEASFQLRTLMRDSAASFEAIEKLEAPTFDQIFRNEELRREFENLTRKLDTPTS
ncbi:MAG: hypothetical protein AAFV69_00505 [Pseudomonadota bacterium]